MDASAISLTSALAISKMVFRIRVTTHHTGRGYERQIICLLVAVDCRPHLLVSKNHTLNFSLLIPIPQKINTVELRSLVFFLLPKSQPLNLNIPIVSPTNSLTSPFPITHLHNPPQMALSPYQSPSPNNPPISEVESSLVLIHDHALLSPQLHAPHNPIIFTSSLSYISPTPSNLPNAKTNCTKSKTPQPCRIISIPRKRKKTDPLITLTDPILPSLAK
ncbi:hypothetical protein Salat_0509800 [Sesamum alatum]|uniref:Uncharacterized protein n=1 Tax=Sesamum alatum TaxID=300844 RepID=A0AAE1Z3X7_9LAMI|nr:hypothetical protein Salat_0509800 [Sesamum alatum]